MLRKCSRNSCCFARTLFMPCSASVRSFSSDCNVAHGFGVPSFEDSIAANAQAAVPSTDAETSRLCPTEFAGLKLPQTLRSSETSLTLLP